MERKKQSIRSNISADQKKPTYRTLWGLKLSLLKWSEVSEMIQEIKLRMKESEVIRKFVYFMVILHVWFNFLIVIFLFSI